MECDTEKLVLKLETNKDESRDQFVDSDSSLIYSCRYACLNETCDKMFMNWLHCNQHMGQVCGIPNMTINWMIQSTSMKADRLKLIVHYQKQTEIFAKKETEIAQEIIETITKKNRKRRKLQKTSRRFI